MSEADWIDRAFHEIERRNWPAVLRESGKPISHEEKVAIFRQAYAAHCQAVDVNGLAVKIADVLSLDDSCRNEDILRIGGVIAPLLAENERLRAENAELMELLKSQRREIEVTSDVAEDRRKLLVECRPCVFTLTTFQGGVADARDLLTRIDREIGWQS